MTRLIEYYTYHILHLFLEIKLVHYTFEQFREVLYINIITSHLFIKESREQSSVWSQWTNQRRWQYRHVLSCLTLHSGYCWRQASFLCMSRYKTVNNIKRAYPNASGNKRIIEMINKLTFNKLPFQLITSDERLFTS